jgi:hydroxyethylthiazole kinase-like uncharacterized protein yjeF
VLSLPSSVALYSTQQITEIEQSYANNISGSTFPLMQRAGRAAFNLLQRKWPEAKKILIVTGKGNNAGDGFVLARLAVESRFKVTLCALVEPLETSGDALTAWHEIPHRAIHLLPVNQLRFSEFDLIVDAMLGTGIKGPLREPFHSVIKHINGNKVPVLALDIPTGVEADTGFVNSEAVKATSTITFVGHKRGMYTGDAALYRGQVWLDSLQIPETIFDQHTFHLSSQNWHSTMHKLKPRSVVAHKGNFGHTIIIGGAEGMAGAAVLASTSAAKSGSGLTSAWTGENAAAALNHITPEVMAKATEVSDIEEQLNQIAEKEVTLVVGPGLGKNDWAQHWVDSISARPRLCEANQIWDADALNLLAELDSRHPNLYNSHRILTPHPGEAARLLNTTVDNIARDRFAAAHSIATRYGGVCILKGAGTIISDEKGFQVVCAVGNPGMASGGMGDVLAGLVGGLLAQKYSLMDAAVLAVSIHGEAADRAAGPKMRYRGLLAKDLLNHFAALLNP